ncbi:inner membrane protein import complex subunit Tim54-domain-containing protein [Mycena olivaceomarginata]|nr:inner membrane protein import complex subunit Tim54-domain-containing protein [Mycena olivaceomarginata]
MNAAEGVSTAPTNWLIFLSVTSSVAGLYIYDRQQCKAIRKSYVEKVKDLADEPVGSLYRPRKVIVYGGKWPGDEDHDQTLKYFRKYVKPILVAAAVDYEMIGGKRLGDIANRVADDIKSQRRLEAGLDARPEVYKELPTYQTPLEERLSQTEGGIAIIGRPTFKEFMTGLKRGWTEPLDKVDRDEILAQELENDGRFDEEDDLERPEPKPFEPLIEPPSVSSTPSPLPQIPPLPPLLLVPFTDILGFTKIPLMIWNFFNQRKRCPNRCGGSSIQHLRTALLRHHILLRRTHRWRGDLEGWQIIAPATRLRGTVVFRDALSVYVDPPPGSTDLN